MARWKDFNERRESKFELRKVCNVVLEKSLFSLYFSPFHMRTLSVAIQIDKHQFAGHAKLGKVFYET